MRANDLRINLILCISDLYPGECDCLPFAVLFFIVCMWSWNVISYSRRMVEIRIE